VSAARAAAEELATPRVEVQGEQVPAAKLKGQLSDHDADHLGQTALLRRWIGSWPPA